MYAGIEIGIEVFATVLGEGDVEDSIEAVIDVGGYEIGEVILVEDNTGYFTIWGDDMSLWADNKVAEFIDTLVSWGVDKNEVIGAITEAVNRDHRNWSKD